MNVAHDKAPWDVRFAEGVTRNFGSLTFIGWQSVAIIVWIALNISAWVHHWDPYPFILLNLVFSTQAAYAAPLILLGQNRQADKDRLMAEHDYEHNETALAYLAALHASTHSPSCTCWTAYLPEDV